MIPGGGERQRKEKDVRRDRPGSDLAAVVVLRISISRASSSTDATSSRLLLLPLAAAGTITDEEDKLALSQKVLLTETKLQNYLKIKELEVFSEKVVGGGEPEERKYN